MVTSTLRRRALLALVILLIMPAYGSGQAGEPGSELRVWLVTAGPGDAVWERYGHNALRVLDTRTGYDVSFNWGIFSFGQPVQFKHVSFGPSQEGGSNVYWVYPAPKGNECQIH